MTRAWMKMLPVMFGLLEMTSSFGQGVTLKKPYDGIEDMRLEEFRLHGCSDWLQRSP
jgi:hypothetical protein